MKTINNKTKKTSNVIGAIVLGAVLLTGTLTIAMPFQPSYAFTSGDRIFGYSASAGVGWIQEWDPVTKTLVQEFQPTSGGNGRGVAFDGVDLWYTSVFANFQGDGFIYKVATNGGADLASIPDPFGPQGRGVGALDYDFNTNTLWGISYLPSNGLERVFQVNPADGTVLASCDVPFGGGGAGAETFALDPNGTTFWTNAGEPIPFVDEYTLPNAVNAGLCVPTGVSFNPTSVNIGGLDFDSSGSFINSPVTTGTIVDLDGNPSAAPVDTITGTRALEDITVVPPTGCSPGFWKTHTDPIKYPNAWPSTSYAPGDDFELVFGVDLPAQFGEPTLEDALNAKGGNKVNQLLRFATATLLNAEQPDIHPEDPYDTAVEIIAIVQAVDADGYTKSSIQDAIAQLAPQTDFLCPITGE